ncbi:MAG: histidinol-phosphatase HisJ family protein [Pirellulaceae bacterium]
MLYESHSHTPLCKHAVGSPSEYAAVADRVGLSGITITCHNPMPDGFSAHVRMAPEEWDEYQRIVAEAAEQWRGRIDVRCGLEADYYPGYEDYVREQIASTPSLSYVIGSVHPQTPEYRRDYRSDDPYNDQVTYFNMLAEAAETNLFDCISHPDLIKNEMPDDWRVDRILDVIAGVLDRIAATRTAMELNTSGRQKKIAEMNPFPQMLRMMRDRDISVVIGADAHVPDRVGEGYLDAMDLLQQAGYDEIVFFVDRQPQRVAIDSARRQLV